MFLTEPWPHARARSMPSRVPVMRRNSCPRSMVWMTVRFTPACSASSIWLSPMPLRAARTAELSRAQSPFMGPHDALVGPAPQAPCALLTCAGEGVKPGPGPLAGRDRRTRARTGPAPLGGGAGPVAEAVRAPGRIRTCDTGFRRAVLYPLSYWGAGLPGALRAVPGQVRSDGASDLEQGSGYGVLGWSPPVAAGRSVIAGAAQGASRCGPAGRPRGVARARRRRTAGNSGGYSPR